jgi:alpha,alpha-trehalase
LNAKHIHQKNYLYCLIKDILAMRILLGTTLLALVFITACKQDTPDSPPEQEVQTFTSPEILYGDLLADVQMAAVFPDGKTFVDCSPKYPAAEIRKKYEAAKDQPEFHLKAFVLENFDLPKQYASGFEADTSRSIAEHINVLWPILTREADQQKEGTLVALPKPYIVPGGRFGEIYYWDSYFTMLGLQAVGKVDMIENMVDNFAYLIDTIGFIPNGNRTYFLTRSQPPFFAAMVQLLSEEKGEKVLEQYLPQLTKEYDFWMDGLEEVSSSKRAVNHVVRLKDGRILNRYFDKGDFPRAEMYRDDMETAELVDRPAKELFADLRAACESGWDFSSRWFEDPAKLHTIQTTAIIPVDLNALLYNMEKAIAQAHSLTGNTEEANLFTQRAEQRAEALLAYCWDAEAGFFKDYNFVKDQFTNVPSIAGMYPLFFEMATQEQATTAAEVIERDFLKDGGVVSTLNNNGQQWDAPNGWAPLQWATIQGLRNYGQDELANTIKSRWIALNTKVYQNTGKMVEKYNVEDMTLEAGGGEYPVQDGFGWSNGVLIKLLSEN